MTIDHTGTEPTAFAEPTEWTFETGERVPTLREQIEYHLGLAHKSAKDHPDRMAMHLAIAAGIGLASTTLDDLEYAEEDEQPQAPLTGGGLFGGVTIDPRLRP